MKRELPNIRKFIYGQPWAITEGWLDSICEIFESNVSGAAQPDFKPGSIEIVDEQGRDYQVVDGVAILPIMGPIFPRANILTQMSGATSLDVLGRRLDEALADEEVSTILFQIDSPGGSVMGLSEMASKIYEARADKTILALAEGTAASAAYMLGSQAEAFFATEGSVVGSIGTIARIDSPDRAMKNAGIDSIVFRSSELKAAGNGPMTPRQEDSMRKVLSTYFEMFKDAVVRGRPGIDIESVATGEVWIGRQAVDIGLADDVKTMSQVMSYYSDSNLVTVY
jgi:capsid assembly protease